MLNREVYLAVFFHAHDIIVEQGIIHTKCHSSLSGSLYLKFQIMTKLECWNYTKFQIPAHDLPLNCNML